MIDILLATYNGAKYINQQIQSLQWQTFTNWRLIIHDDGSTDNTLEIIESFMISEPRIELVKDNVVFKSASSNFMHLLKFSNAEFIMFCDQDDIWFENKLELMFNTISIKNNIRPQIVYSRAFVWDANAIIGSIPLYEPKRLNDFLFLNSGVNGCFAIFNRSMIEILNKQPLEQAMHDHLLLLVGLLHGEVTYMEDCLMLYRRHSDTVTNPDWSRDNFKKIKSISSVIDYKHWTAVKQYILQNKLPISKENEVILNTYCSLNDYSKLQVLKFVFSNKMTLSGKVSRLLLKTLIKPTFDKN